MEPNYNAMTDEQERAILIALIDEGELCILHADSNPEIHDVLREELTNDVLGRYKEKHDTDDYDDLFEPEFIELLDTVAGEMSTDALLGLGDIYSIARETLNNEILDRWVVENPAQAYPINYMEVQDDPNALSISDDDQCASCQFLAYAPGDQSVCRLIAKSSQPSVGEEAWPCEFDENGYAEECEHFNPLNQPDGNWVIEAE